MQVIVADLETAGYITQARDGRRTRYTIYPGRLFRHPAQHGHQIRPFLAGLDNSARPGGPVADGIGQVLNEAADGRALPA